MTYDLTNDGDFHHGVALQHMLSDGEALDLRGADALVLPRLRRARDIEYSMYSLS